MARLSCEQLPLEVGQAFSGLDGFRQSAGLARQVAARDLFVVLTQNFMTLVAADGLRHGVE